ncbi:MULTISPECIES: bifunctional glutamate--cysteine ligase GshA/glutathione synthetase GshB [Aerococcus]|uniref:Glutathione biosynthesis bifunctional protein GshAB n=1 Tax=Aerococcus viridans TaxID=1377 RepID=A0A2N6UCD8_9LACT|nr:MULTISPECIES: bifunctional glutamate--cysteine ligase GshA/glutathione synthetase GshB [Aerococcus]OFU52821.1 bifunctional glutamate--cysteine ligase/glutathione synthetase [Aerococcus sp. HMSC10H05]PMC79237.1 bifunctional glutamate--cysteine ligase GshA/glutathione synthetase GshB [Aerococcus viridans]
MNWLQSFIQRADISHTFKEASIGIEREGHRITPAGQLALTPHPKQVDGSTTSFYIQRDFAESQLELVTPPVYTSDQVMEWLQAIHEVVIESLTEEERIWPFSMPPVLPEDEAIAVADLEDASAVAYRDYLVEVYGKKLQMISGIHYNMQVSPDFIQKLHEEAKAVEGNKQSLKAFQSDFYLRLARNFLRYQWILVYLFGAAPIADDSFFRVPSDKFDHPVRSIRNSHLGYINKDDVTFTYDNLEDYVAQLEANVTEKRLIAEKEFYSNVRLRGANKARSLLDKGIKYLEFRLIDIQPDAPYGIKASDIDFIKYFVLYLIWSGKDVSMADVHYGIDLKTKVAEEDTFSKTQAMEEGLVILSEMKDMLAAINADQSIIDTTEVMVERLKDPTLTPAGKMMTSMQDVDGYLEAGRQLAEELYQSSWEKPYALGGFEDMELSTQILMFDAIQEGYQMDILDRDDQMIRLKYKTHEEIVKNANITSKDPYIGHYVMENKVVTKALLAEHGIHVPKSLEFNQFNEALKVADLYSEKAFVIKPKSTNMGIGISIFKKGASKQAFKAALEIAFREDHTVLIEDFAFGTEYRFYVQEGKVLSIVNRVGANVIGDGVSTVKALVDKKNEDPKRGIDHRSPLEKIQLGEIEVNTLKQQGLTPDDIIPEGKQVILRENSNISTGGDSIEVLADMHESYKEIAIKMAKVLGVKITGLDLMIEDIHTPATADNYALIEANFNPMMMMHIYPAFGEGKRITKDLLAFLFPEKTKFTGGK